MNIRQYLSVPPISVYVIVLVILSTIIFHACYTPEANVKNQSSNNGYSTNLHKKTPAENPYSEANWQKTFDNDKILLPNIQLLRSYVKELGLEKNIESLYTLLDSGMKNVTIDNTFDINVYKKNMGDDSTIKIGLYNYALANEKDKIERLLIDFVLMGVTSEKIQSVYNKYQLNMFRNTPYGFATIKSEPLYKECFSSTIIVGEFENIQSDLTPKDGFRSSITIKVISVLKGSVNSDKIIIRGYSGDDSDGYATSFSHSPENFNYTIGLPQIFYLSHELYVSEIFAPSGYSRKYDIDKNAKIERKNFYKCLFPPTEIKNGSIDDQEEVKKCKGIAKMLR